MRIEKIGISGFKSLKNFELSDFGNFGIFAGANGSGKSNFFDALKFVSLCISHGLNTSLATYGGFEYIHCFRMKKESARTFKFLIQVFDDLNVRHEYSLIIRKMDCDPHMVESIKINNILVCERKEDGKVFLHSFSSTGEKSFNKISYPSNLPIINIRPDNPIYQLLADVRLYRIDPIAAKNSSLLGWNSNCLDVNGQNIAKILAELKKNSVFFEKLNEFMSLVVPGLRDVSTERQDLEIRTILAFKEVGLKKRFPAHLVSDGTIYLLCLFTAILHPLCQKGITLIEEPERGINPKPIEELVSLLRSQASNEHFIFVTTHNETVVRSAFPSELVFAYKENGITKIKFGREYADIVKTVPLDTAWLSNMFGSGLPW